jgi:Na+/H+ antiporter NhaD/arsenite permease-like protein
MPWARSCDANYVISFLLIDQRQPITDDDMTIDLAWISLAALMLVIVLSCTTAVNPGCVSLALAWVIGVYLAPLWGKRFTISEVMSGFPTELFLTLVGVTLLFTLARGNGTLDQVVRVALSICRGNAGLIPIVFFGLSVGIASVGAGNIATAALIGPLAMAVGDRVKISPLLMTLMVGHGSIAGALSPIAPTGIIANGLMARMGLSGFERQNYLYNLLANTLAAGAAYLAFGGLRLFRGAHDDQRSTQGISNLPPAMVWQHWITLGAIVVLVIGVVGFQVHVGMGAFAAAVVLILVRAADERPVIQTMPWGVIVMVCGVTVLTSLLEKTGGIDLFTTILARFATQRSITGLIALVTGIMSVYSSTSGVVLPALLPSVPGLIIKLGGGNPLAIASSILIGGHLVDVSPLSTVGALCIASAPTSTDRRLLFNQVLVWGLSMSVAGAVGCYLAFGRW